LSPGWFGPKSFGRRLATRATVILGAVLLGGQIARTLPHDQVLVFPIGSAFPRAQRFAASWKRPKEAEAMGGMDLSFANRPPLVIRHHASLPDGEYVLSLEIVEKPDSEAGSAGMQTNLERRVTLSGGETKVALAAGGF